MLEKRNLKLDLFALALLALTIFLAASLLSYPPADPPSKLVSPVRTETLNVCGQWGALVSRGLFTTFGLGAYYLLVSLTALDVVLLSRRGVTQPVLRAAGWFISLAGVSTLAAMAVPQLSPGPVIGSGGYLGAAGRGLLQMNFAAFGAYVLAISMILGGLLLCTDYLLIHVFAWAVGKPAAHLGRGVIQVSAAYAQKVAGKRPELPTDGKQQDEEPEDLFDEVAVRIAGRRATRSCSSVGFRPRRDVPTRNRSPPWRPGRRRRWRR